MTAILTNWGSSDKQLSATEAAYLAGFFDGEGCFTIGRASRKEHRAGFSYFALMTASGTHLDTMKALLAMCANGKIQVEKKGRRNPLHKTCYRIIFGAKQIRHLLPQIQPYLITKRQQAELLMEFLALKREAQDRHTTGEQWAGYERLRCQIRTLNRRGTVDTTPSELTVRADGRTVPWLRPKRSCAVDGCGRKHWEHGYCVAHHYEHVGRTKYQKRGPYDKACAICGKAFVARRSDTACCSVKCGNRKRYLENTEKRKAYVAAWRQRRKQSPQT